MEPRVAILSTLALKGVLEKFEAPFAKALGAGLDLRFDATQAILRRLAEGTAGPADLLILTAEAMHDLHKRGQVVQVRLLGSSGVGVAVRAGAPRPDIGSVDAFIRALVNAQSVAHSKFGASGLYFSEVLKKLNLEEKLKKRVIVEKGPVGLAVARGEAEIGVQQLCELAPVAGIDIVGPLPAPLQQMTQFSAGIPANAANAKAAAALIELLRSDTARAAMTAGGFEPAA